MSPSQPFRVGLVGPDRTQPCGIADYTARLAAALAGKCELAFVPFRDALTDPRLKAVFKEVNLGLTSFAKL